MSVDLIEKSDLYAFEHRMMTFMEQIAQEPLKQWFSKQDLAEFRRCSISEFDKRPELLPNHGVPEDRWGRTVVWSRETVKGWLLHTKEELSDEADAMSPEEIEKAEFLRRAASVRRNVVTLHK